MTGPSSRIGAHASVSHALLGARVNLHIGVHEEQEGFSHFHNTIVGEKGPG